MTSSTETNSIVVFEAGGRGETAAYHCEHGGKGLRSGWQLLLIQQDQDLRPHWPAVFRRMKNML